MRRWIGISASAETSGGEQMVVKQNKRAGRGKFITVEGGEGAGKSTNLEYIRDYLTAAGVSLLSTREPGGTALGEAIRDLLLSHEYAGMAADSELLLMFAARAEHLSQLIEPALARGEWVLCDRFTDATYAYQGYGRNMGGEHIAVLEQLVQGELRPDLTILLDIDVTTGLGRANNRSDPDRFEVEQQAFFERVRQGYRERAKAEPERFAVIDTNQDLSGVQREIAQVLDRFVEQA